MSKTVDDAGSVLVVGATGSFGAAASLELLSRGVPVRLFARDLERARRRFGNRANAQYLVGDAADDAAVADAMQGCRTVIVGIDFEPADQAAGIARLADLLGRFAPATTSAGRHDSERCVPAGLAPEERAPGGRIGVAVWSHATAGLAADPALSAAAGRAGVDVVLLRCGPLFGPTVRNWVIDRLCRSALQWKTIRGVVDLEAPSSWTYAPDAARLLVDDLLGERPAGASGSGAIRTVACPPYPLSQRLFLTELGRTAIRQTMPPGMSVESLNGHAEPRVGVLSPLSRRVASWLDASARETLAHHAISGARATERSHEAADPSAPPWATATTPLEAALRLTLTSYRQGR